MRKVKINDNQGQSVEVDIDEFKKHLDEYHSSGSSVHDEDGHYFTVDQNFREKLIVYMNKNNLILYIGILIFGLAAPFIFPAFKVQLSILCI